VKIKLTRPRDATPRHFFPLRIPILLYERMIAEGNLRWGDVTPFILSAIREKLDRQKKEGKT
jgi:hypothetical protein